MTIEERVTRCAIRIARDEDLITAIVREEMRAAVEEEREACAMVAQMAYTEFNSKKMPATAARVAELIRARCNKSKEGQNET